MGDFDEVNRLAYDLDAAAAGALPAVRVAMQKTAADIKRDAQIFAPVDTGNLRNSITYETRELATSVVAEIGPTAEYGHYVEFGTSRMAPHAFMGPALDRNAPSLEQALAQFVDKSVR